MKKDYAKVEVHKSKTIALIAHDGKKDDLINWVFRNKETLSNHFLCATGTTGKLINEITGLPVKVYNSGPLGGDQQIGCRIVEGKIDIVIFIVDPLEAQPHDPDVKALLRIASVYDIPIANNISTAEYIIKSELINIEYEKKVLDYSKTVNRKIDLELDVD